MRAKVGREASCEIFLDHSSISRLHARIERRDDGWWVIDEGSTNGTFLESRKVREAIFHPGEKIQFGMLVFDVQVAAVRSPADEEPTRVDPPRRPTARLRVVAPTAPAPPSPAAVPAKGPRLAEAAARLGVDPAATSAELDAHFQKVWNEYQVRLANAPTPTLKKLYQKNLLEAKAAYDLLAAQFPSTT